MITALDRYLKSNGYQVSIVRDREFAASKKILEGVAVELRRNGKGKLANRSRILSLEDEEILWTHREFGKNTPRAISHTLWWYLSQHRGIRGRSEHHNLQIEDLAVENDGKREFVIVYERITKNHWGGGGGGGVHHKPRKVKAKMFAAQGKRNPVEFFTLYAEKRPSSLRNSGPLYLSIIDNPKTPDVWYKISRMGIHTIGNFMKGMMARTPLKDLGRKFTNHSARKTSVREMKRYGYVNSN